MTVAASTRIAYRSLLKLRGEAIVYRAGAVEENLIAIPAEDEFTRESGEITTEVKTRSFLIEASTLILATVASEPEPGHEIDWDGKTFEIVSPGGSIPAWTYEGSHHFFYRVQAREI